MSNSKNILPVYVAEFAGIRCRKIFILPVYVAAFTGIRFEKRKIFWEPVVAAGVLLMAILGTMVPLYMYSDKMNRSQIEAIRQDVGAIREEMRDFHDRLFEIEAKRK